MRPAKVRDGIPVEGREGQRRRSLWAGPGPQRAGGPVGEGPTERTGDRSCHGRVLFPLGPLLGRGSDRNILQDIGPGYHKGTRISRYWAGNLAWWVASQKASRGDVCGLLVPKLPELREDEGEALRVRAS